MKKVLLVLALIVFSSPVFAQATYPNSDKRIADVMSCQILAQDLELKAFYNPSVFEAGNMLAKIAHASTIYKNLCMK